MKKFLSVFLAVTLALVISACKNDSRSDNINMPWQIPTQPTTETTPPSSNPLIAAELQHGYVFNGSKTKIIGQYAYIRISKSTLKNISLEEYTEFCETVVDNSIYNWVSIICDDWTGICFAGSQYCIATYGEIDYEGIIQKNIGDIIQTNNGFIYEECTY